LTRYYPGAPPVKLNAAHPVANAQRPPTEFRWWPMAKRYQAAGGVSTVSIR
jgi:hypothetical protein